MKFFAIAFTFVSLIWLIATIFAMAGVSNLPTDEASRLLSLVMLLVCILGMTQKQNKSYF